MGSESTAADATKTSAATATNPEAGHDTDPEAIAARRATALEQSREDIRFDALRNALYHQSRRSFCDGIHRWQMFTVIMAGSGAVASLATQLRWLTPSLALLAATSAAADVAFDWAGKGREHAYLARRYYEILAEVEEAGDTIKQCRKLRAALARLYGEERPPMRAVDAIAYNAAQTSLYGDEAKRVQVRAHQSLLRHIIPFAHADFPRVIDRQPSPV